MAGDRLRDAGGTDLPAAARERVDAVGRVAGGSDPVTAAGDMEGGVGRVAGGTLCHVEGMEPRVTCTVASLQYANVMSVADRTIASWGRLQPPQGTRSTTMLRDMLYTTQSAACTSTVAPLRTTLACFDTCLVI